MKKAKLNFKLSEMLVLVFEVHLFFAGVIMLVMVLNGTTGGLAVPAEIMCTMLPAMMPVGFALWLVYRLRAIRQAKNRTVALLGAGCLGMVAISFGAAVGKLSTLYMSEIYRGNLTSLFEDPVLQRAGLTSLLAFLAIGVTFAVTFVLKAGKGPFEREATSEELHARLNQLSQRVVQNWPESLVAKVDALVEGGETSQAIEYYQKKTRCSEDEATIVVSDWQEQRLMLQVELLDRTVLEKAGRQQSHQAVSLKSAVS